MSWGPLIGSVVVDLAGWTHVKYLLLLLKDHRLDCTDGYAVYFVVAARFAFVLWLGQ
jgi:hypothetical protein